MADKTFDETRPDITAAGAGEGRVTEGSSIEGEASQGPSGLGTGETSAGGADSVPATPDSPPYSPADSGSEGTGQESSRRPSAT